MAKMDDIIREVGEMKVLLVGNGAGILDQVKELKGEFEDFMQNRADTCPISETVTKTCNDIKRLHNGMRAKELTDLEGEIKKLEAEKESDEVRRKERRLFWFKFAGVAISVLGLLLGGIRFMLSQQNGISKEDVRAIVEEVVNGDD
jgi:hypothetical protein